MRAPGGSLQILFFFLVMTGLLCVRLRARAAARVQDLEYAYIKPNRYYAVFGTESCFQVMVPDYARLEVEFGLLHGPMFSTTGYKTVMASQKRSAISSFSYTPRDKGWYKLVATIHDPYSGSLTIQTGPFHCSNQAAGVELLSARISSIMALMHREGCKSAYEKALFVHDWLIHNADYDESLKVYDPYTLLFSGVGVCQSYALAYQMLLHEAGVKCLYVVGYAGGDKHAFNLVNFDGAWAWVDVTWDDPKGGGSENHDHFGLNDILMRRTHDWSQNLFCKPPAATSLSYHYHMRKGAVPYFSREDLAKMLDRELRRKNAGIYFTYLGKEKELHQGREIKQWLDKNCVSYDVEKWVLAGLTTYSGTLQVSYLDLSAHHEYKDEGELARILARETAARANPIRVRYAGGDRRHDISATLHALLKQHCTKWGVANCNISFYPRHAALRVDYRSKP